MKNKRTTIIAGLTAICLLAIIVAFQNVPDPKGSKGGAKKEAKKSEGKSACEVSNGRAALLAQKAKTSQYDLTKLLAKKELIAVNREVIASPDKKYSAIKINEKEGERAVWIKDVKFSKGQ